MDRRYRENQLDGGAPAPGGRIAQRERLVEQYLSQARAQNRKAQSFGGSTGRAGGFYGADAPTQSAVVSSLRGADTREQRSIFDQAGGKSLGLSKSGFGASRSWRAESLDVKPRGTT